MNDRAPSSWIVMASSSNRAEIEVGCFPQASIMLFLTGIEM